MTNINKYATKYSSDVETMVVNDNGYSWDRERTSDELQNFVQRHLAIVGELDLSEYDAA